jgi:hypothetical protein
VYIHHLHTMAVPIGTKNAQKVQPCSEQVSTLSQKAQQQLNMCCGPVHRGKRYEGLQVAGQQRQCRSEGVDEGLR